MKMDKSVLLLSLPWAFLLLGHNAAAQEAQPQSQVYVLRGEVFDVADIGPARWLKINLWQGRELLASAVTDSCGSYRMEILAECIQEDVEKKLICYGLYSGKDYVILHQADKIQLDPDLVHNFEVRVMESQGGCTSSVTYVKYEDPMRKHPSRDITEMLQSSPNVFGW